MITPFLTPVHEPTFCHNCAGDFHPAYRHTTVLYGEQVSVCRPGCYHRLKIAWHPTVALEYTSVFQTWLNWLRGH